MIRDGRSADRPAVTRLQGLLAEPAPELLSPAAGGELLVSTDNAGAIVGYLLWFSGDPVYVAEMVVAPAYRREGRGSSLILTLFDRLSASTTVDLRVAAGNKGAQQLYCELGFERVAVEPDAYDSETGYRMRVVVGED